MQSPRASAKTKGTEAVKLWMKPGRKVKRIEHANAGTKARALQLMKKEAMNEERDEMEHNFREGQNKDGVR